MYIDAVEYHFWTRKITIARARGSPGASANWQREPAVPYRRRLLSVGTTPTPIDSKRAFLSRSVAAREPRWTVASSWLESNCTNRRIPFRLTTAGCPGNAARLINSTRPASVSRKFPKNKISGAGYRLIAPERRFDPAPRCVPRGASYGGMNKATTRSDDGV